MLLFSLIGIALLFFSLCLMVLLWPLCVLSLLLLLPVLLWSLIPDWQKQCLLSKENQILEHMSSMDDQITYLHILLEDLPDSNLFLHWTFSKSRAIRPSASVSSTTWYSGSETWEFSINFWRSSYLRIAKSLLNQTFLKPRFLSFEKIGFLFSKRKV